MLAVKQNHVYTDVKLEGNDELSTLGQIAKMVSAEFDVSLQEVRSGLFAREVRGTSAISQHVIMPHVIVDGIDQPEILTISWADPMAWDATSAKQIQVAIVMVMPRAAESMDFRSIAKRMRELLADPAQEEALLASRHNVSALSEIVDLILPAELN